MPAINSLPPLPYTLPPYPTSLPPSLKGVKYPLRWVKAIQAKSTADHRWKVLVDAAAYAATQPLDLTQCPADFVDV